MDLQNEDILQHQLKLIELWNGAQNACYTIQALLNSGKYGYSNRDDKQLAEAFERIANALHRQELLAWRNLGLLGLAMDDDERTQIRALAYKKFYEECKDVMSILDPKGRMPSDYFGKDEQILRKWLDEHFKPDGAPHG